MCRRRYRPYTETSRTPVGLCTDAPLLVVIYPKQNAVDWPALLNRAMLRPEQLFSGASVWIAYLSEYDSAWLATRSTVTLADIVHLMAQDAAAFA